MKTEMIEINWGLLGAKFALIDDKEQAEFFKGLAHELNNYDSHYKAESQMCFINLLLDDKSKDILEDLLPAIWFKDKR
jgi:hypothetical protein